MNSLTTMSCAPDGFPYESNAVRLALGWSVAEMRAARAQRLDAADFARHQKRIFLSARAVELLGGDLSVVVKKNGAAGAPSAARRILRVVRADLRNTRLALACPDNEDPDRPRTLFRLRLRAGTILRRRQRVEARALPPYRDYFEFLGLSVTETSEADS